MEVIRCRWVNPKNPRYIAYHDEEWGVPCHDEVKLFEYLNLEGAQAGLSWETILNRRENYALAFDQWDAQKIAAFDESKKAQLLLDAGIIRNRLKIAATISNARAYIAMREQGITLEHWLWDHVDGKPLVNAWQHPAAPPASTDLSDLISLRLRQRGFKFVGSTIIYAYMQAMGIVNDHSVDCFRHNTDTHKHE